MFNCSKVTGLAKMIYNETSIFAKDISGVHTPSYDILFRPNPTLHCNQEISFWDGFTSTATVDCAIHGGPTQVASRVSVFEMYNDGITKKCVGSFSGPFQYVAKQAGRLFYTFNNEVGDMIGCQESAKNCLGNDQNKGFIDVDSRIPESWFVLGCMGLLVLASIIMYIRHQHQKVNELSQQLSAAEERQRMLANSTMRTVSQIDRSQKEELGSLLGRVEETRRDGAVVAHNLSSQINRFAFVAAYFIADLYSIVAPGRRQADPSAQGIGLGNLDANQMDIEEPGVSSDLVIA